MNNDKLVKKLRKADGNAYKFILLATQVIDIEVESDPDNKKVISMFTARDMALGSLVSRNKHIAIGVAIGVTVTTAGVVGALKLREVLLKRRKENENTRYN